MQWPRSEYQKYSLLADISFCTARKAAAGTEKQNKKLRKNIIWKYGGVKRELNRAHTYNMNDISLPGAGSGPAPGKGIWLPLYVYEIIDLHKSTIENSRYCLELGTKSCVQAVAPCWRSMSPWRAVSTPFRSCCCWYDGTLFAEFT